MCEIFRLIRTAALYVFLGLSLSGCLSKVSDEEARVSAFSDPAPNQAPVISGTPRSGVQVNNPYDFQPEASDADNDALSFSVSRLPSWASFNGATGRLSGTPIDADIGVHTNIVISVSDGTETADLAPFSITVSTVDVPNSPPIISGTPRTSVNADRAYSFTPTATDVDNDVLTFAVSRLPPWATFDQATGELSGIPTAADVGTFPNISIRVTDGEFTAMLPEFTISVTVAVAPNSPPVISGTPSTSVDANSAYSFTPTASDADGDALIFSVSGLPAWASFNDGTGRISGTPGDADIGVYSNIGISVSDGAATADLAPFSISVNAVVVSNSPPVISGTPPTDVDANNAYSFAPTASDVDGDALAFSIIGLPVWANFNGATGRINGTPADTDVGVYSDILISVSDGTATAGLAPFSITVNAGTTPPPANSPPVISGTPPTSVDADSAYSFTPTASDSDGDTLTYSVLGLPTWASFSAMTGQVSGTPGDSDVGNHPNIRISVSDGTATADLAPFSITVNALLTNTPPVISGTPATNVNANSAYAFTPTASDADGDALTFSVLGLPAWASINAATGQISGTPGDADVGVYPNIRISVSDGSVSADLAPFSITVNAVAVPTNTPPVISGAPPTSVDANSLYSFVPTASDADGDAMTFSVSGLPAWGNFSSATGQISGTPSDADAGVHPNIRISVSDGSASADLAPFSVTVNATNLPPAISGTPPTSVDANSAYSFTPTATDPDGDSLTFSVAGLPGWASFSTANGQISGTPDNTDAGVHANIRIAVSDGTATANLAAFSVTVNATNSPPVISGAPSTSVDANTAYSFTPTASDADGDTLIFSIAGLPGWANFNTATGRLNGTPEDADVGVHSNIRISVSDGTATANLAAFSITVNATNSPPVISGAPSTSVDANTAYSFTPTASDADGDTLIFSIAGLPGWANFNTATGRLNGTPGDADVGSYPNIRISVSDGTGTANLAAFSITVNATNSPPVISGAPSTSVDVNTAYSFTPTASDADGDTLTFSISGLPVWANFNSANGRVNGTPGDADVGVYSNIQISVSDGTATANLAPFSITVNAISLGSVTLSWTAPTQNEDGTPLTDLASYKIYYGTESGNYTTEIVINNPGVTTYVVDNLTPDTYYFVATATNSSGEESRYSGELVRDLN